MRSVISDPENVSPSVDIYATETEMIELLIVVWGGIASFQLYIRNEGLALFFYYHSKRYEPV